MTATAKKKSTSFSAWSAIKIHKKKFRSHKKKSNSFTNTRNINKRQESAINYVKAQGTKQKTKPLLNSKWNKEPPQQQAYENSQKNKAIFVTMISV